VRSTLDAVSVEGGTRFETAEDDDARDEVAIASGDHVQRFVLLERIGAGSMGELHTAYDAQLDRKIALKLVRFGRRSRKADARLLREAQALAKLSHPNVVTVYEVGSAGDRVFVAMEYVEGQTLAAWLRDAAALPRARRIRELLAHFRAAGRGLAAVHAAGFAHRDFKPENVQVGNDGRVRLIDFGLARSLIDAGDSQTELRVIAADEPAPALPMHASLTTSNTLLGTPRFMAPEQWSMQRGDGRSDQFAFAVALYQALYGSWPFEGASVPALREAVLDAPLPNPPRMREVPSRLRAALLRNLAREPEQRSPDMSELLAAIDEALAPARLRLALLLVLLALVGSLAVLSLQREATPAFASTSQRVAARVANELAAERRRAQVDDQLDALVAAGDRAGADALFASFAALPQHAHTEALARAWRQRAGHLRGWLEADAELAALGEAHWASSTPSGRREVLVELALALAREHRHVQLGAALGVLDEQHADAPDDMLIAARMREATSRLDFASARAWLARAPAPDSIAALDPLLRELERARGSELYVPAVLPQQSSIVRVPGLDLDGDGSDELAFMPRRGQVELLLATPALARDTTLELADQNEGLHEPTRPPGRARPADARPWLITNGHEAMQLVALARERGELVATPDRQVRGRWVLGELFAGEGWAGEEWLGLDVRRRAIIGVREGSVDFEASPSLSELNSSPADAIIDDLDDDGRDELIVGVGGWWAYDVRVMQPRESPQLELAARLKLATVADLTTYRSRQGRRLAVALRPDSPNPRVFSGPTHTGATPGLHLLDWAGPGHDLEPLASLALPRAQHLYACDLDGDALDELIVQLDAGFVLVAPHTQPLEQGTLWLDGLRMQTCHDLDRDGDDELIVSELAGGRVHVLGSGDAPLPVRPRVIETPLPPPPRLPATLREPWQRADTLVRLGLHDQASAAFVELARLVEPELATLAHVRAGELALRSGRRREAATLFESAGSSESLARALQLRVALHELDAAATLAEQLAARDPSWRVRADELRVLTSPSDALHFDLRAPLDARWRVARPGLLRHTRGGLHVESLGGSAPLLAARPFTWTGKRLTLEVELEVSRLEWGAAIRFEIVSDEGVPVANVLVGSTGGGGRYVLDIAADHRLEPGSYGDKPIIQGAILSDGPRVVRLRLDVLRDTADAWIAADVRRPSQTTPEAELAFSPKIPAAPLRGRHFELRLLAGDEPWQRGVARIVRIELVGAEDGPAARPASVREQALLALVNGEHEQALALLDASELAPREAAWLRLLALEQLGRFDASAPALARAIAGCDDEAARAYFAYALRVEPDRFGPRLRELCSPDRFVMMTWAVAWDALFQHPDLGDLHRTMTTQLPELDRFEPTTPELTRAAADLLTARSRGWLMQGLEAASESDLRRAIELVEQALARPIADPALRLALERLVSLAYVRLAVVLLERNRPDEVARALHLALTSDRAPEIIADVALARGTFAPLREQPIWAELLAAQRGHRPPPDPAHAHRHPR
jgi:tRNA A-37 threonylcarbamoyl transferase component Bud32/tetratricopeptide (TPR) repeat protein